MTTEIIIIMETVRQASWTERLFKIDQVLDKALDKVIEHLELKLKQKKAEIEKVQKNVD